MFYFRTVAGWGRLSELKDAPMGAVLQETRIRMKTIPECRKETQRLVRFNTESMLCGFERNTDACQVRCIFN